MEIGSNSRRDLTSLVTQVGEMDLDHELGNSHECTQNCFGDETMGTINNTRVRKLSNEVTPSESEETTNKTESIIGEVEPHMSDYAVAGLSYVESQEPGELAQAIALDIVDKLLSDNDVGSSQEIDAGKTEVVKSPPILSVKGVQSLAKSADHRNSFGRTGIYDWPDSLEDEGTGGKRKGHYPGSGGDELGGHSRSEKPRHHRSTATKGPADKNGGKEGLNFNIHPKVKSLPRSDSRLTLGNSIQSENLHISETERKKLCKDMDEESNSKFLEQQLDPNDVVEDAEVMYNVGPDTQMAAEAMEALFHGSPVNYELSEDAPPVAGNLTEDSSRDMTMAKAFSKNVLLRKRVSSCHDPKGIVIPSKIRKVSHTKLSRGSPRPSREHSSSSLVKNNLETEKIKVKNEKWKLDGHLNVRGSLNTSESTRPSKRNKAWGTVDDTFAGEINKYSSSMTDQLSVRRKLIRNKHLINKTPVAHRTRQSKSKLTSKLSETSSCIYRKPINELMVVNNPGVRIGEDKLAADASGPLRPRRKGHVEGLNQITKSGRNITSHSEMQVIDGHREEEPSSLKKDAFSHPKRRRTCHNTREGLNNSNLNNRSVLDNGMLAAIMQPYTRRRKIEASVKSLPEVLDSAKRRKRSVFSHLPSKTDDVPFNTRKVPTRSCVSARLSVNSPSFKPYSENDSNVCLTKPFSDAVSTDATNYCPATAMNHRVPLKDVALPNQGTDSVSHVEDVEENAKLYGSPKGKAQLFGVVCTPLKKMNTMSPSAHGPPRTSCNKSLLESSNARELIGLKATESAFQRPLKDSRRRKSLASVRVLFSNNLDEDVIKQQKKILARLGILIASSISDATHFVTDKFARTRNMLEAIAMGKPVVTHMWIESCGQASCFIDEKKYILRDLKKEKEIGFSMVVSLARARQCPLLQGRRVFITPNIKPDRELVASLVKAAHGQLMERIEKFAMKADKILDDLLVISCEEDYAVCTPLLAKGAEIFSSELLLNGLVIQKLEFERHHLFFNHAKQTAQ